eukprot:COSAG01_NODE_26394_length_715_cov_1.569805_1_plen_44_part_10
MATLLHAACMAARKCQLIRAITAGAGIYYAHDCSQQPAQIQPYA